MQKVSERFVVRDVPQELSADRELVLFAVLQSIGQNIVQSALLLDSKTALEAASDSSTSFHDDGKKVKLAVAAHGGALAYASDALRRGAGHNWLHMTGHI